jgi:hypothetical protein
MKPGKAFLCSCALLLMLAPGQVRAQIIAPAVVNGNTYTCYFISQLDIFTTDIRFDEKGMMHLSAYAGNGFYFTLTDAFMGAYWILNQKIGPNPAGDYIFILLGRTRDPLISGTCLLIYEYKRVYFPVFFGFRAVDETP